MSRLTSRIERIETETRPPTSHVRVVRLIWDPAKETLAEAKARYQAEHGEPFPADDAEGTLVIIREIIRCGDGRSD